MNDTMSHFRGLSQKKLRLSRLPEPISELPCVLHLSRQYMRQMANRVESTQDTCGLVEESPNSCSLIVDGLPSRMQLA